MKTNTGNDKINDKFFTLFFRYLASRQFSDSRGGTVMIQSQIKPSDVESSVQLAQPCSNDEPTSVTVIMSSDSDGDNDFSDIQLTSDIYGQSVQVLNDSNLDIFDNCSPQDNAS